MFDIGFSELLLVFIIGLVVLGPQRLPVAVKTVVGWIRALRSLATTVQNELTQEFKLQELQDSLKKVEKASMDNLTPELKESMDELRQAAEAMKRSYTANDPEKASDEAHSIHNPVTEGAQPGTTPGEAASQADAPSQKPHTAEPAPEAGNAETTTASGPETAPERRDSSQSTNDKS
ncbi:Sec-independent protein translocase subunit TatB [Enterobacteriaceae bacterium BIT-l23]|uniref:Sec-independent protein translocase protein TatB n=1 Tax=Jejubacter sp. L23 TaxID=3092086 RepID=UPI001584D105|nr:Sec-independent protein translocase subunit TatB [Enterobacteriaceae bacterium BIT-l23]